MLDANLYLACKQQQLYGPVTYRGFREKGPIPLPLPASLLARAFARLASLAKIGELARRQVRLLHAVFGYSQWFKFSISERWIVFDWQNFGMSSIKFDYRTQSKSIERLEFDWV